MPGNSVPAAPITIMLVCGEPSGDQLGAQLMQALRMLGGSSLRIVGVGGPAMEAQGLKSLFPLSDTAVMGLREVVPKIPAILRRVREACDFALATKPNAVVLIDSPDFTHRIARRLKRLDPSMITINYVAPQVWASRAYRARKMARYFDLVLALLPFEAPFFEQHGLHSVFVGHPAVERIARMKGGADLRSRLGIPAGAPLLAVLPGSRANEIRFILPPFREAVALIAERVPGLQTIIAAVPHLTTRLREQTHGWPAPLHIVESEDDKYATFNAANAALAASGTVTTELALAGTPMVVGYKLGWLTYTLVRPFVRVQYATLANLLLDRLAIPEFIQDKCTPQALADAAIALLTDKQVREKQVADLKEAAARLGLGEQQPSLRAAQAILDFAV
jgi:lipid-A-disaccharide synthase